MSNYNFVEVKSRADYRMANTDTMVRVSFPEYINRNTNTVLGSHISVHIGQEVADKLGWKAGDKVKFFVDAENPRIILIKKSFDSVGTTLINPKQADGSSSKSLRVNKVWREFTPGEDERQIRKVSFDIFQNGLRLFCIIHD